MRKRFKVIHGDRVIYVWAISAKQATRLAGIDPKHDELVVVAQERLKSPMTRHKPDTRRRDLCPR